MCVIYVLFDVLEMYVGYICVLVVVCVLLTLTFHSATLLRMLRVLNVFDVSFYGGLQKSCSNLCEERGSSLLLSARSYRGSCLHLER